MRKILVDYSGRFAKPTSRQGRAAFSGIVGYHQRETRIARAGPQRRLAHARMPDHGDVPRIDRRVGFKIVQRTAQAPCPRANRAPIVRGEFGLPLLLQIISTDAVLPAFRVVGFDVRARNRGDSVAALERRFDRPQVGVRDRFDIGLGEHFRLGLAVYRPMLADRAAGIAADCVIAVEVHANERRRRFLCAIRDIQKEVNARRVFVIRNGDRDFFSRRKAVQRSRVGRCDIEFQRGGFGGAVT